MSLLAELKRRNVFRVGIFYIVSAWLMLQIADLIFEVLLVPSWTLRFMFGALVAVFPFVLFLAWAYELTPEGIKRDSEVDRSASVATETGRKLNVTTIVLVLLGIGFLLVDRLVLTDSEPRAETNDDSSVPLATTADLSRGNASTAEAADARASVAVLPFADLSPEQDQQYFSDGIAEEILNVLVGIEDLKVASRTSAFAFRGEGTGIPEIAATLGVRHILEGSVRKAGSRVRVTAQLIDSKDDAHVWSETFERELTDVFAIQDEIARAVYNALLKAFGQGITEQGALIQASTDNLDAYELFLEGRALFYARDRLLDAVALLEQAVAIDPEFARAWEMLAAVYSIAPSWGLADYDEFLPKSDAAAEEALRLDPERYFAMAVLAQSEITRETVDWNRAQSLLERSLAGNSNDPSAWLWLSITQRFLGYLGPSRESIDQCLRVDPAYENCRTHLLYLDLATGNIEAALAWLDRSLAEADVRFYILYPRLAPHFVRQGDLRTALLLLAPGGPGLSTAAARLWIQGLEASEAERPDFARRISALDPPNTNDLVDVTLGNFEALESGWDVRQSMWRDDLSTFRRSQRFHDLIEEMGIANYWREHGLPPQCRDVDGRFECD